MSDPVVTWWASLCTVAVINITAWSLAAAWHKRHRKETTADISAARRLQLALSGLYVAGCAFRSFLPVYDIPRLCLVDTWASSVLVGRSIATLAELAFAAQWAVFLHACGRAMAGEVVRTVALVILPLIAIAEVFSWYAVLTTWNFGHVVENSLWGISGALIVACLLAIAPRWHSRRLPVVWIVGGVAYVTFMFLVDVPMYWSRWLTDQAQAREYLSITEGIVEASRCRLVSIRWEDWRSEVAWMTLYFSAGGWVSLSLVFARTPPTPRPRIPTPLN